ncbi:MAG: hypothetical protein ACODAU_04140 [Myxococcota bacterium]
MRRAARAAWMLWPVVALPAPAAAQPASEHASSESADMAPQMEVRPTEGLVTGDTVTLTISLDVDAEDAVAVPEQSFAPFEVRRKDVREEPTEAGRTRHLFSLELLAFEPGEHRVGPVELQVTTADGHIRTATTRTATVRVGSLLANEPNAEPKPPTEPVRVMEDDYTLLWILGGLAAIAAVALLTLLLARWWRRRRAAAAPPAPPRPAHEVALEKLHALRGDRLRAEQEDRLVEWVDGVSDALRQYLGGRYGFVGLESTSDEVLSHLRHAALSEPLITEVSALLGECDLVKFAQVSPEPERCDDLLEGAYRVVQRTRPAEPAPPPAKEAA